MIRFPCTCGHRFEVGDELAGSSIQCPSCRRLIDVPQLGQLEMLADDGTYRVDSTAPPKHEGALERMLYVYARTKVDQHGNEIDLREVVGQEDGPGEYDLEKPPDPPGAPRYDPETGERITHLPLAENPDAIQAEDPSNIPFAKPAVGYATRGAMHAQESAHVLLDLCRPWNAAVMTFIFFMNLAVGMFTLFAIMGLYFIGLVLLPLAMSIPAHFANVVQDIGYEDLDELPRPFRDFQFWDDLWHPFINFMAATLICYGVPIFLLLSPLSDIKAVMLAIPFALAGSFLFPMVFLTLISGSTVVNLRPDRVVDAIRACGQRYFGVVLAWTAAAVSWTLAMMGMVLGALRWTSHDDPLPGWISRWPIVMPMLVIGIFLMHFACWHIGLLYRAFHEQFPWVGRYHVREPREPG